MFLCRSGFISVPLAPLMSFGLEARVSFCPYVAQLCMKRLPVSEAHSTGRKLPPHPSYTPSSSRAPDLSHRPRVGPSAATPSVSLNLEKVWHDIGMVALATFLDSY
ncbi:hypothetical protein B0H12DRAFT_1069726 [Mycena haematopus]|nr:hypothetical protein B0H12DRAFT_1069726 [Mycena haematopus]